MFIDGINNDELEKLYQNIDNDISTIYHSITESQSIYEAWRLIGFIKFKFFLSNLFWRIPANDILVDTYFSLVNPSDLPFRIKGLDDEKEFKMKSALAKSENFKKLARYLMLPELTFNFIDEPSFINKWDFLYIPEKKRWNKRLTCDNPIIYKDIEDLFALRNNILFPLSGNKTLVCIDKLDITKKPDSNDSAAFDVAVFSNATRYVCGADKDYLLWVSEIYTKFEESYGTNTHAQIINDTFQLFYRKSPSLGVAE
jgi:hypothetical protein